MSARVRVVARIAGGRGSRLPSYVVLSMLAHVVVTAALVLMPSLRGRDHIPQDAFEVVLVAPAPSPARAQPQPAAPAPQPPPEKVPAKPPEGMRATTVEPETPKPLPEKIEPAPDKPKPVETPTPAAPLPGEASGVGDPPPGGPQGDVDIAMAGDVEFAWYRASVKAALHSNWRKPILEGIGDPREVLVTFEILRDGSVRAIRVERSSGVRSLDRSALRAVSDAAPLPALPRNWSEAVLPAGFIFRLYPE